MSFFKPSFLRSRPDQPPAAASPAVVAPSKAEKAGQRQHKNAIKIDDYFQRLEAANNKRSNIPATRDFIEKRTALDKKRDELHAARSESPEDKKRIKEIKREKDALQDETRKLYTRGPLGLTDEELSKKRKQQHVPASIEGLHTALGARIFSALSGITGTEIGSAGGKIALHQSLGYGTQSGASGLLRIVTEIIQTRGNEAGRPRMAPNLAPKGSFKQNRRDLENAKATLLNSQQNLQRALDRFKADESEINLQRLQKQQDQVAGAIAELLKFEGAYENLCIMLEKEFRGKKASAAVSVAAGFMSAGAFAVEPTGAAAIAGHHLLCLGGLLLQMPMSAMDYMDGTVDYPQKISADKIDLKFLLKKEAWDKPVEELQDADFDTSAAARLYDEKPQLVQEVIRSTYRHELSKLNTERLRLRKDIEKRNFSKLPMGWKSAGSQQQHAQKKQDELEEVDRKFSALETQIALYEQHGRYQLDPDGLIGRAIRDPIFFCRKGINATVFNKVGEFFAQANQRISNNFNPLVSLGLVAIGQDIVTAEVGATFFKEGLHSFAGTGPENHAAQDGVIGLSSVQAVGAANSGVTVISARVGKAEDRKLLGSPAYIGQGAGVDTSEPALEQLKEAQKNGIISERKMKKLSAASEILQRSRAPSATPDKRAQVDKAQKRWDDFQDHCAEVNKMVAEINRDWVVELKDRQGNPMLDHQGKAIVIDLRQTAECLAAYMSLLERAWIPIKGVPRSLLRSVTFWRDVIRAKRTADECKPLVDHGKVRDPQLRDLMSEAQRVVARKNAAAPLPLDLRNEDPAQEFTVKNLFASLKETLPRPSAYKAPAALAQIKVLKHQLRTLERGLGPASWQRPFVVAPLGEANSYQLSDSEIGRQSIDLHHALMNFDSGGLSLLDSAAKKVAGKDLAEMRGLIHDLRTYSERRSLPDLRAGMARGRLDQRQFDHYRQHQNTLGVLNQSIRRLDELDRALAPGRYRAAA